MSDAVWTIRTALEWTAGYLEGKGIEQPRVSAEWLLSAATGLSRIELYAHHDRPLSDAERATLRQGVKHRAEGTPLQYVTGEMPFRHIVVHVQQGVFIPRPETEILVGVGLDAITDCTGPRVVELCVGSGCISCAVATESPTATVYATDLNPIAVSVSLQNVERLDIGERVSILEGDLFGPLPNELRGTVDLIIANPPYIPTKNLPELPEEVLGYEPHLALDGGPDGLSVARRIMDEARRWLAPGGVLAIELDEGCVDIAHGEMQTWYEHVRTEKDLAGRDRVVVGALGKNRG